MFFRTKTTVNSLLYLYGQRSNSLMFHVFYNVNGNLSFSIKIQKKIK